MSKEVVRAIIKKALEKYRNSRILFDAQSYNDSVSRLYYAVFHAISAVLFSKGMTYSSHKETIGNFNREFIKTGIFDQSYSKKIDFLFNARQTGDYDFKRDIDEEQAVTAFEYAGEIVEGCKRHLSAFYNVDVSFWG